MYGSKRVDLLLYRHMAASIFVLEVDRDTSTPILKNQDPKPKKNRNPKPKKDQDPKNQTSPILRKLKT
jgi:hypothetical protein